MKNKSWPKQKEEDIEGKKLLSFDKYHSETENNITNNYVSVSNNDLAEILFVSSYPPRQCGIATYSQDLIIALGNKFSNCLSLKVCALEADEMSFQYPEEVKYVLKTSIPDSYDQIAEKINRDPYIRFVVIEHEFGFFVKQESAFLRFLTTLQKPVVVAFHTVLPVPDANQKLKVRSIAFACKSIVVMTNNSADILVNDYGISKEKIEVIAHGTHLVPHLSKEFLKNKHSLKGRRILTTFGLLSSGKSIETTLKALPAIIKINPDVLFLIIGKTHPEVLKEEGEAYRISLEKMVVESRLTDYVKFINSYLSLHDLLEYLQLTDIYLFTSKDPAQAVSGTFAYAMSCGCPIISTPIPHAKEVLTEDTGIIFDFLNSEQLSEAVIKLLNDANLRRHVRVNTLQKIVSTAWENSAVRHMMIFQKFSKKIAINYNLPPVNINHIENLTTETGIIQFSRINQPDLCSGYTLDDNARALIAMCMHYIMSLAGNSIWYINKYLRFIKLSQQPAGNFLNYFDIEQKPSPLNNTANLDDANGRAIWALGYLVSQKDHLPEKTISEASAILKKALPHIETIYSPRAIAFAIKGLYYYQKGIKSSEIRNLILTLADRLVRLYENESSEKWNWFEGYLTYANSVLPEAMLYSWLLSGEAVYKKIALSSLNFLLSIIFNENGIEVISNKSWLKKGQIPSHYGEQPIDVAYTVMTLSRFYEVFTDKGYRAKMETAFSWFLGNNRLHQIIYNPCTGGCYDGLEETHVNLNQGAESAVCYLMARLTIENFRKHVRNQRIYIGVLDDNIKPENVLINSPKEPPVETNGFFKNNIRM